MSPTPLLRALLLAATLLTPAADGRSCRILFLEGPPNAPESLHLFDGTASRVVDLPRMNLSRVYELPDGPLRLRLLPTPPAEPAAIPAAAPAVTVAERVTDFYLLVTSDPSNTLVPVRMQVINANADQLRPGQMLWFNLTANSVGGTLGSATLSIAPAARVLLDAPASGNQDYPVRLHFRIPGKTPLYPLCETKWRHDPRSRSLAFIIAQNGNRSPRVLVFPDFRQPPPKKP